MPNRTIETGPDFLAGPHEGLSATMDGRVFPADANLLPDPAWRQLDQYGWLVGWAYPAYPLPVAGMSVYARAPGGGQRRRIWENTIEAGLRWARDVSGALVVPPAPSMLKAPRAPNASALSNDPAYDWGWPLGWYGVAFALGRRGKFTGVSPRASLHAEYDYETALSISAALDAASATRADEIAWFATGPQASEVDALGAPLRLLLSQPLAGGSTTPSVFVEGPGRLGGAPGANATTPPGAGPVDWRYKPVRGARLEAMDIDLAWSWTTNSGRSAQQESVRVQTSGGRGKAIAAWPPYKSAGALAWRLEWRVHGTAGQWLALPDSADFDSPQFVYRDDSGGSDQITLVDAQVADASGLADPQDLPIASFGYENIDGGVWSFSATALYPLPGSGLALADRPLVESGPSPETNVSVPSFAGAQILLRPPGGNVLHNPLGRERKLDASSPDGVPLGYTFGSGVTGDVVDGQIAVQDASGASTLASAVALERAHVSQAPHVFRTSLDFDGFAGGTVRIVARQVNSAGTQLSETVIYQSSTGTDQTETELVVEPQSGLAAFDVRVEHDGTAAARNLSYGATIEAYEGRAAPDRGRAGGYVEWVDNPEHRHSDLDGYELGMVEYFGAYGEPLADGAHPLGLKIPVRPNQAYALSVYAEPTGLESGANLWSSAFFDRNGKLLQSNPPLATFTGGGVTGPYARKVALLVAPANPSTSYFEIVGSRLGRGRLRLMGLQWEKGTTATAYDPGVDQENPGTDPRTLEVIQYVGYVGSDDQPNPPAAVREMFSVKGVPEVTVVGEGIQGIQYQSAESESGPWSPPVEDPAELGLGGSRSYVKYLIELGAS